MNENELSDSGKEDDGEAKQHEERTCIDHHVHIRVFNHLIHQFFEVNHHWHFHIARHARFYCFDIKECVQVRDLVTTAIDFIVISR